MARVRPPTVADVTARAATGRSFIAREVAEQKQALLAPPMHSAGQAAPSPESAVAVAESLSGWWRLAGAERRRLAAIVQGPHSVLAATVRQALLELVAQPETKQKSARAQAARLAELPLTAAPDRVYGELRTVSMDNARLLESTPLGAFRFRGGSEAARRCRLQVGEHRVEVVVPARYDAALFSSVAMALSCLPPAARDGIATVILEPRPHGGPAAPGFDEVTMWIEGRRVTIFPTTTLLDTTALILDLLHEAGHGLTITRWGWGVDPRGKRWRDWRAAIRDDAGAVVSRYASVDATEDVAETIAVYCGTLGTPTHDEYRALVPARFALLDRLLAM
jgi:hypothetical protein